MSEENQSFTHWKTKGKSWKSGANQSSSGYATNNNNLSSSSQNNTRNPSRTTWAPYSNSGSRAPEGGYNDSVNRTWPVNGRISEGTVADSHKYKDMERVSQSGMYQDANSQQGLNPYASIRQLREPNTNPVIQGRGGRMNHLPNKPRLRPTESISNRNSLIASGSQSNQASTNLGTSNQTRDNAKTFQRPLGHNHYAKQKQVTYNRNVLPHAEDLQPNEGFTGVKTTITPGVPKVLSTTTSSTAVSFRGTGGRGLRGGRLRPGAWAGRGNWKGRDRGFAGHNSSVTSTQPHAQSSASSSSLSPSGPPQDKQSTPHRLPSAALNKALNNQKIIPQKRRKPPSPDPAVSLSLSSSSSMSISPLSSENSGTRNSEKTNYRHLPAGPWKTKRRKAETTDNRERQVSEIISDESPSLAPEIMEPNDRVVEEGSVDELLDGTNYDQRQRDTFFDTKVKLESSDIDAELVYPSSSPNRRSPSGISSTTYPNDANKNASVPPATSTLSVKDEPFDLELPDFAPAQDRPSGTERYHPIPPSCRKFHENGTSASTSSSSLASSRLVANPHYNTARSEYTQRACAELRAKGLIPQRVLWRDDGLCIDWVRSVLRDDKGTAGGRVLEAKGRKKATHSQTRLGKEAHKRTIFDDLISMTDDGSQVKSEPQPEISPFNQSPSEPKPLALPLELDIIDLTVDEIDDTSTSDLADISDTLQADLSTSNIKPSKEDAVVRGVNGHPLHQAFPVSKVKSPADPHADIIEFDGDAVWSSFIDVDDAGDTEEEIQVQDELVLNHELSNTDMGGRLTSKEHMSKKRSFESVKFTDHPELKRSSQRRPPALEAEQILEARTSDPRSFGVIGPSSTERSAVNLAEKARMEGLAIAFLRRYINSWEYDRASLAHAYAPNAIFSCSVILPKASSGKSINESPTHIFASHFASSMSAMNRDSSTSSNLNRGPPVPIQTPTVIMPALLLLDPQRAYTFFPSEGQAEVVYDVLYLGEVGDSSRETVQSGSSSALVYLGVQAELKRKTPEVTDNILDVLMSELGQTGQKNRRKNMDEAEVCIGWNFVLSEGDEEDSFALQIVSHQMMIRDRVH
ncbi:hypothetical protein EV361DRAFT_925074 [Lentinula raphanica]|nr:hypothetical protein EV361DRAFT_925074 [Lentinula raphanica]